MGVQQRKEERERDKQECFAFQNPRTKKKWVAHGVNRGGEIKGGLRIKVMLVINR